MLYRCGHWGVNTCVRTCSLSWVLHISLFADKYNIGKWRKLKGCNWYVRPPQLCHWLNLSRIHLFNAPGWNLCTVDRCSSANCKNELLIGVVRQNAPTIIDTKNDMQTSHFAELCISTKFIFSNNRVTWNYTEISPINLLEILADTVLRKTIGLLSFVN